MLEVEIGRDNYLEELTTDFVRQEALRYGLSTEQIGSHWLLSEAGVFLRYLYDLDLRREELEGKDCIDVGCGYGLFKNGLLKWVSPRLFVNLDCRERPFNQIGVIDVAANARQMPFPDESFDVVLAYGSIAGVFWDDYSTRSRLKVMAPEALEEIIRILRPGGTAKIGPVSLLRSCWRSELELDLYRQTARQIILASLVRIEERYPMIRVMLRRNREKKTEMFDEWLEFRK